VPTSNPFRASACIDLAAKEAQAVTVEVYDVPGGVRRARPPRGGAFWGADQQVRGKVTAGETEAMRLGAPGLASGVYLVRVTGETLAATWRLTVVR
jgi:hypothetical protein